MDIKIIDVTLRDGGYKTDFHFSDNEIEEIISTLDQSKIEYIEVGYRNGSLHPILNIGNSGLCTKEYLRKCRRLITRSKLTVMLHPKNIGDNDLKELLNCGVDLVRICIFKKNCEDSYAFINKVKKIGLSLSVNITRVSHYTDKELDTLVSMLDSLGVDMICFADSNGSMLPLRIKSIYKKYVQKYKISFGFHAYDNLGLAQANVIAALNSGAQYIDASLFGLGKGIGNLKLELFAAYLHAIGIKKYNLQTLLNASNFVRHIFGKYGYTININELEMGISDLSIDDINNLSLPGNLKLKSISNHVPQV